MKSVFYRIALCVGMSGLAATALAQSAANYPSRSIKIIVPFAPGGTTDILARLVGQRLTQSWGQPVVIENKPGAGATLGADMVAKSAPDGYTLLMGAAHHTIAQKVYAKIPYQFDRDFAPITMVAMVPNMVVVNSDVPAKTIAEFIALSKSQPGKFNYGSAGAGTAHHLIGEMFKLRSGVDLVHIPYKGSGAALTDLMGGQVLFATDSLTAAMTHIRSGRLRALATTDATREASLPDVPTLAESGLPGLQVAAIGGLFAPKGTPKEVVDKVADATRKVLANPEVQKRFAAVETDPLNLSIPAFNELRRKEAEVWSPLVRQLDLKQE